MTTQILLRAGASNPRNILLGSSVIAALTGIGNLLIQHALLAGVGSEAFSGTASMTLTVGQTAAIGGGARVGDNTPLVRWDPLARGYAIGRKPRR